MPLKLDTPVQFIKGVGPKLGDVLKKKGVATVQDLLEWYPRAYEDRRAARTIASLQPDELVSLKAKVIRVSSFNMGASRRKIYDVILSDGTGKIHCKFFRVPYKGFFERFKPNQDVRVIGKVSAYKGQFEFNHPDIQDDAPEDGGSGEPAAKDEMIPVYPESEGLTNRAIRKLVNFALDEIRASVAHESDVAKLGSTKAKASRAEQGSRSFEPAAAPRLEKIPLWIREKYDLVDRMTALEKVHIQSKDQESSRWRS